MTKTRMRVDGITFRARPSQAQGRKARSAFVRLAKRQTGSLLARLKFFLAKKWLYRITLGTSTLVAVIAGAAAFSAFEAHVINVTARIENALSVETGVLEFEEVFPQEYLTKDLQITLSQSFKDAAKADDVEYVIKQKPKVKQPCLQDCPQDPNDNPVPGDPYAVINLPGSAGSAPFSGPAWQFCEERLPENAPYGPYDPSSIYWKYCYIPLANYLSKHKTSDEKNNGLLTDGPNFDKEIDAFHYAYQWNNGTSSLVSSAIARGKLQKSAQDVEDTWIIDLAVPCFKGFCAQDWEKFVHSKNPQADPNAFVLPKELEHKMFGTDLWVEVTEVSRTDHHEDLTCEPGKAVSQVVASYHATNPANYDNVVDDVVNPTAGDAPDHLWVAFQGSDSMIWDMGTSTPHVWLVPGIDHDIVPAEGIETLIYGSNATSGPWTLGTRSHSYTDGPSNWVSDDVTNLWTFNTAYRYIKAIPGKANGPDALAQGVLQSNDTEIDAVCANKVGNDMTVTQSPPTGLVAHYKLDENSGSTATDSSGNGLNGNLVNSPAWTPAGGHLSGALSFNGVDQLVELGNPAALNFGNNSFSYSLWVNVPSSATSYDMPISKGGWSASAGGYDMELGTGGWLACISDTSNIACPAFGNEVLNQWMLLTVVVDRGANVVKTYENGALTEIIGIAGFGSVSNGISAHLGKGTHAFKGLLDDVRIYNHALTDNEIFNIYSGL